ncbi:hypothetical protein HHK36_024510 [Tetracentron sinense]|uniref:ERAD-associated E3 ubiquitin-protein ligase component HRD3A n=1 Tax=Tetracentron sinense TaxID=13715 RepID=A0A834YL09_TETSI|nr:hypothetical protein HHK36_024510 [Tetracentron sinense]
MHRQTFKPHSLFFVFLILSLITLSAKARPVLLLISEDDLKESSPSSADEDSVIGESSDQDEFDDSDNKSEDEIDPGSWRRIFEPDSTAAPKSDEEDRYYSYVQKMILSVALDDPRLMEEAGSEIEAAAIGGFPHAQSALGFLYETGQTRERDERKAFLYHHFAAEGGNMHSKMVLAYTYLRQDMYEEAVKLYAELAEAAVASFLISKNSPVIEPVRIHNGAEENTEALRKSRGEEDEDFQVMEYQAEKGNAGAMYKMGIFYYFGLRGVKRDHAKALSWVLKAVDKREPRSMELLGEIYASGAGVKRNFTRAFEWLSLASKQQHFSAYNGMGYLYVKGYGVEKNYTKAKDCFQKAADNEAGGDYNLGVLYLKAIGVKRDLRTACNYFLKAATAGHPKAFYQLAKMSHTGVGLQKNLPMATALYRSVAERGPWISLSRWALESYLKGEMGKALLLYSRMAELGYEVAQSNAAWILDKYGEHSICLGESGFCTDAERHQRAHSLWWHASEQGNEHAALLIGDAYYYGRGTERDYDRAAEAYKNAKSKSNAQAMFNLGYMHEHGQGLPLDLHLAKRYYDQALKTDPAAKLPVTLALMSLWIRKNYADSFLIDFIDSLPDVCPKVGTWVSVIMDGGNVTILTLFICLLTVLYLRERQRRRAAVAAVEVVIPLHPDEHDVPAPN